MRVTLYRDGKEWKSFVCDEMDIITDDSRSRDEGALFLVKPNLEQNGIIIDAEIPTQAEFGENQITLFQVVS